MEHNVEDRINTLLTRDPNKEAIYLLGYDSHSFRAYNYWRDKFPDICQAEEGTKCYECGGITFTEHDVITYEGKTYTGEEFYESFGNSR